MSRWWDSLQKKPDAKHQERVFALVAAELKAHQEQSEPEGLWLRRLTWIAPLAAAAIAIIWTRRPRIQINQSAESLALLDWEDLLESDGPTDEELVDIEDLELIEELETLEKWQNS